MRVTTLKMNNFRCFEDFEIRFDERFNLHVLIAENMVGKSAIMRALRIAANTYVNGIITLPGYGIERTDHRVVGRNVISDISLNSSIEVEATLVDEKGKSQKVHWLKYKDKPVQNRTKIELLNGTSNPSDIAKNVYKYTIAHKASLPLINFIGTEYIHVLSSETTKFSIDGNAMEGYKDCLNDKSIQKFLFAWLGKLDGILGESSRKKIVAESYGDFPHDAWFVCQEAVKSLLPSIIAIEWLADKKQPIVEFDNGDIRLFDMLSDGYRYLILLAIELATRAIILNKHLGKDVLKEVTGLVIIDEFGIHLHPSLQSETLTRLQSTFPKVQFILSTHSPLLVNGLKREQVHILEMGENGTRTVRHPQVDVVGLGAEGILRDLFGLETTFDDTSLQLNEDYKKLLGKKTSGVLSASERDQFTKLSEQLAPMRLDPTLQVKQDDPITNMVKEKLEERQQKLVTNTSSKKALPKDLPEQVENILDDIFQTVK